MAAILSGPQCVNEYYVCYGMVLIRQQESPQPVIMYFQLGAWEQISVKLNKKTIISFQEIVI